LTSHWIAQSLTAVHFFGTRPELWRPHIAIVWERGGRGRGRWWRRCRCHSRLEQVVQQGEQREQQKDGERYEANQAPVARARDAPLLESKLPCATADVLIGGRRVISTSADEADILVPVEAAAASFTTGWAASFTANSTSGPRICPTSAVGSSSTVTPAVGRGSSTSVVG